MLTFVNLLRPALRGVPNARRVAILKFFIKYICFVCSCNDRVDVSELNFYMDLEN